MSKIIKLFDVNFGNKENDAINRVLKSKFWASGSGVGNVAKFELEFKKFVNSRECIAVSNGTAALHLALAMEEIKNKEVILPSLSFVSTAHAVIYNGGKPVFVDVEPETLCMDPSKIEDAITKKTKVILPVHFGGMPCNLTKMKKICRKYSLSLVEDAAHAAGSSYKNKMIGSHGKAVCFSFHPAKNLAMPTGGAITLNDSNDGKTRDVLKSLRWCGISNRHGPKYDVSSLGWNYYMNEFSAAIGLVQLKKLNKMNNKRKNIAKRYFKEIQNENKMPYNKDCAYHLYWIQVSKRNEFMKKMKESNIETGIHYLPIHKMKFYTGKKLHITESVSKKIVSIPMHANLTESEVTKVIKFVNKFSN
jgi:perosamine synthetase